MPQGMTGVTAASADRFVFGPGEVYINISIAALEAASPSVSNFDDAIASAIKLGATRGGSTLNLNRTLRAMPVDGQLGPTKGFIRREEVAPVLTTNVMEQTIANWRRMIAGITTAVVGEAGDGYTRVRGGEITNDAYLDNVALVATYSGSARPVILVLYNVMAHAAPEVSLPNRDEVVMAVTFNAHIDPASPYVEPWAFYHPEEISS